VLNLLKRYKSTVIDYQIHLYEHESSLLRFKATVIIVDGSRLQIKEYRFSDGSRKYAYHWESAVGILKIRWDNAEHWPNVSTFPHHKHFDDSDNVQPSTETCLEDVLKQIASHINNS
jgi:hypothetical protein